MKKRLLAGLMTTAMLAMTLAGCGSSSSSGEQTSAEGGETASSGDGYSMTLIMSLRDEFLSTLEEKYEFRLKDCLWMTTETYQERSYGF